MSIHRSLRTAGKLARERNVFTRLERLQILKKEKRWQEGETIYGLPKVRTRFKIRTRKKEKPAAEAAGAAAAGDAAAGGAAAGATAAAKEAPAGKAAGGKAAGGKAAGGKAAGGRGKGKK